MEDDHETLDWGNEDDEPQNSPPNGPHSHSKGLDIDYRRSGDTEDVEDAVSLGGDEDDIQDYMTYQSNSDKPGNVKATPAPPAWQRARGDASKVEAERDTTPSPRRESSPLFQSPTRANSSSNRIHPPPQNLTHALPPKPVVSSAFLAMPSTTAASPMSMARRDKERRVNGMEKAIDSVESLPPDWEVRYSRSGGRDAYYYNLKTFESTWIRPSINDGRSPSHSGKSRPRGDVGISWMVGRDDDVLTNDIPAPRARVGEVPHDDGLSYNDRHYRPGDALPPPGANQANAREDRPHPSASSRLQLSGRETPDFDDLERRQPQGDYQRELVDGPRRGRRSSSVQPRDNGVHRASDKDDLRPDAPFSYHDSDHRQDIHDPYARDAPRAPSTYNRPHQSDVFAGPREGPREAHVSQELHSSGQNATWASSAPRHRSLSPRNNARSSQYPRQTIERPQFVPRTDISSARPVPRQPRSDSRAPSPAPRHSYMDSHGRPRDAYAPSEAVPLRRGRDNDVVMADADYDAKRRRTDAHTGDSAPARRVPQEDTDVYLSREQSYDSSSPISGSAQSDSRLRKRIPLPPQSDRFREMAQDPSGAAPNPPPPSRTVVSSRAPFQPQIPSSTPSGPRNALQHNMHALPPPAAFDYHLDRRSSGLVAPGSARNRPLENTGHTFAVDSTGRDKDAMDVDTTYLSRAPFDNSSRHRPAIYERPPRSEVQNRDFVPRAPRGFPVQPPHGPTPSSPTSPSFDRRTHGTDFVPTRPRERQPPAHPRDSWPGHREPAPSPYPPPAARVVHHRPDTTLSGNATRPLPYESSQERPSRAQYDKHEAQYQDVQVPRAQHHDTPLGPAPKIAVTNSVPAASRSGPQIGLPPPIPSQLPPPSTLTRRGSIHTTHVESGHSHPTLEFAPHWERPSSQTMRPPLPRMPPASSRSTHSDVNEGVTAHNGSFEPPSSVPRLNAAQQHRTNLVPAPGQGHERPSRFGPPLQQPSVSQDTPRTIPPTEPNRTWTRREPTTEPPHAQENVRQLPTPPSHPLGSWEHDPHTRSAPRHTRPSPDYGPPSENLRLRQSHSNVDLRSDVAPQSRPHPSRPRSGSMDMNHPVLHHNVPHDASYIQPRQESNYRSRERYPAQHRQDPAYPPPSRTQERVPAVWDRPQEPYANHPPPPVTSSRGRGHMLPPSTRFHDRDSTFRGHTTRPYVPDSAHGRYSENPASMDRPGREEISSRPLSKTPGDHTLSPTSRRGPSLLDRLSSDSIPTAAVPSLRDRVAARHELDAMGDAEQLGDETVDEDYGDADDKSSLKRRVGKVRIKRPH